MSGDILLVAVLLVLCAAVGAGQLVREWQEGRR